jgi:hypothetical protein
MSPPGGPAELREAAIAFANKAVAENLPLARVRDRDEKVLEARGNEQLFADFRASIARKTRGFLAPSTTSSASRPPPTCRSTRASRSRASSSWS